MIVETGDIVQLESGERRLVVETKDEIVPCMGGFGTKNGAFALRTLYRLAGVDGSYPENWFTKDELSVFSKRR